MDGKSPEKNPWSNLSTVNTFDKGNHSWTTRRADETENQGQIVGRVAPATSLLIESLIQQLCTLFEGDVSRRNKLYYAICDRLYEMKLIDGSYNKIEFETMRGQYQLALYQLVAVARALTGSESPLKVPNGLIAEWSRYRREFNEIGFIARGAFGNVFKAEHRLDGNVYAIKKIVVASGRVKTIMKYLEEVKTISRLNHTNIVSYKGAWIESNFPANFVPSLPSCSSRCRMRSHENNVDRETNSIEERSRANNESESIEICQSDVDGESDRSNQLKNVAYKAGGYITSVVNKSTSDMCGSSAGYLVSHDIINERFKQLNCTTNIIGERISERLYCKIADEEFSDIVTFRSETASGPFTDSNGNLSLSERSNLNDKNEPTENETDSWDEAVSEQQLCKYNSSMSSQYVTLYIQMGLCDQTLNQWLQERNEPTPSHMVAAILTQILTGLEYIHSLDIVHHDIKPHNIFISKSANLKIQLGDFGLACLLQKDGYHTMRGTQMYAAPEQLNGKCNPKSDIYSIGIVLLELLVPMETCMERSRVVTALRKGEIPAVLATKFPQWAQIIRQLVQEDPKNRPSPTDLLKHLSEDKDTIITNLKEENMRKDHLIQKLQDRIAELEATIKNKKIPHDDA